MRSMAEHAEQVVGHRQTQQPRHDDPAEKSAGQPVGFPRPFLNTPVGDVEAARGQAAEPVEDNAEKRIRIH